MDKKIKQLIFKIEDKINSKIELLRKGFARVVKTLAKTQIAENTYGTEEYIQKLADLAVLHIKEYHDGISSILLDEIRKGNNIPIKDIEQIVYKYCIKEKENKSKEMLLLLESYNHEDFYKNLDFDDIVEHELNLKANGLQVEYQKIKDSFEIKRVAIRASRAALFSAMAAVTSAICALIDEEILPFIFKHIMKLYS